MKDGNFRDSADSFLPPPGGTRNAGGNRAWNGSARPGSSRTMGKAEDGQAWMRSKRCKTCKAAFLPQGIFHFPDGFYRKNPHS